MGNRQLRLDYSSAFGRQYKKLSDSDKDLADAAIKRLVRYLNLPPRSEQAMTLQADLRVKVIQRFKTKNPRRMELTFAPDGRIVWAIDKGVIRFIYIGNHSVLDKD